MSPSQSQNNSPELYFTYFDVIVVSLAIVANCIVLVAVIYCKMNLPGYRRFLISLSAGDLFICIVHVLTLSFQEFAGANNDQTATEPVNDANLTSQRIFKCGANILRTLKLVGFFNNLLNICGMSADHFVGIVYPMRYKLLMSKNVTRFVVIAIWIFSFLLASLDIPVALYYYGGIFRGDGAKEEFENPFRKDYDFVEHKFTFDNQKDPQEILDMLEKIEPPPAISFINTFSNPNNEDNLKNEVAAVIDTKASLDRMLSMLKDEDERKEYQQNSACILFNSGKMWVEIAVIALAAICFVFLTICYGIIFKKVSNRMDASSGHPRKLIFTTLIFLGAFMVCWVPFMVSEFTMLLIFQGATNSSPAQDQYSGYYLTGKILSSLLMFYPLIDPIVYAARIPAIQQCILLQLSMVCNSSCIAERLTKHNRQLLVSRKSTSRGTSFSQQYPLLQKVRQTPKKATCSISCRNSPMTPSGGAETFI